jgi:predicted peptidase
MDRNSLVAPPLQPPCGLPAVTFLVRAQGGFRFLVFSVNSTGRYRVVASLDGQTAQADVQMTTADQLVTLKLAANNSKSCDSLNAGDESALISELNKFYLAKPEEQANWTFPAKLENLLVQNESAVCALAWNAYRTVSKHADLKRNFDAKRVTFQSYTSPYTVKAVGVRPAKGWPLFVALHGGGGAPKELNDSQWRHMQVYYKDHAEAGGYLYLALRAPNDTWNGFYDDYVYPLIDNLILQFRLFGDIDPDKVFIMGYSHGGYGAYAIGPKMPDRFAEIHASAAAATDGETTAKTLRTTKFTAMVGELDTAYDRCQRNLRFQKEVETLRAGRTDIYPVNVTVVAGNGHTGLPDRDLIKDMYPSVRNPVPSELDWLQTDSMVRDFFWLRDDKPCKGQEIVASCLENVLDITANEKVSDLKILLDNRLIDFSRPLKINVNGSTAIRTLKPSLRTFCETLIQRGDPEFAFSSAIELHRDSNGKIQLQ